MNKYQVCRSALWSAKEVLALITVDAATPSEAAVKWAELQDEVDEYDEVCVQGDDSTDPPMRFMFDIDIDSDDDELEVFYEAYRI
jgi:hypothetical protein